LLKAETTHGPGAEYDAETEDLAESPEVPAAPAAPAARVRPPRPADWDTMVRCQRKNRKQQGGRSS